MSVTVANTTANLSGAELLKKDGTHTITGSMTFDRDPSAPFVVTSGSAVVTNLDADKVDGYEASALAVLAEAETVSGAWIHSADLTLNDNVNLTFGTGGDADVYYDGTNLYINPRIVGTGNTILAAGDFYTTAMTDYSATSTVVGWASFTTKKIFYKKVGKLVFVWYDLEGTSNATTLTFTLPVATSAVLDVYFSPGYAVDNAASVNTAQGRVLVGAPSSAAFYKDFADGAWTNTSTKRIAGQFVYEATS